MKEELAKIEILMKMMSRFSLTELYRLLEIGNTIVKMKKETEDGQTSKNRA
jgi:hypothetical protein